MLELLAFLVAILSLGCSTTPATRRSEPSAPAVLQADVPRWSGPTEEEANDRRARPYIEGMRALERLRASGACDDPNVDIILARITELEEMSASLHRYGSFRQHAQAARERHTRLAFAFADEVLERGCFDMADRVYRRLLSLYEAPGAEETADRAAEGLEAVYALRATAR